MHTFDFVAATYRGDVYVCANCWEVDRIEPSDYGEKRVILNMPDDPCQDGAVFIKDGRVVTRTPL